MTEQQYTVIADSANGDNVYAVLRKPHDRVTYGVNGYDVVRVERPVLTTDEPKGYDLDDLRAASAQLSTRGLDMEALAVQAAIVALDQPSPSVPTREQIAEVVLACFHAPDRTHASWWINPEAAADAVLALTEKGTGR